MTNDLRIGFVGLGSQGGPMARRIVDAGFSTTLWARRPQSLEPYADTQVQRATSLRDLGAASDVLGVCVVDDAGVDAVLRGPDGALAAMRPGGIVVVHSTTHPDTCRRLQADFPHLRVLDAPVSGGGERAAEGTLLVMVGGDPDVLDEVRPVLLTFADPLLHVGGLGTAQEAKLLNNTLFTAQLGLVAETMRLGQERGLDVQALSRILTDGSGRSYAIEVLGRAGHRLDVFGVHAGALLRKDVGILDDLLGVSLGAGEPSPLLDAAHHALTRMAPEGSP